MADDNSHDSNNVSRIPQEEDISNKEPVGMTDEEIEELVLKELFQSHLTFMYEFGLHLYYDTDICMNPVNNADFGARLAFELNEYCYRPDTRDEFPQITVDISSLPDIIDTTLSVQIINTLLNSFEKLSNYKSAFDMNEVMQGTAGMPDVGKFKLFGNNDYFMYVTLRYGELTDLSIR